MAYHGKVVNMKIIRKRNTRRGVTLVELLASTIILSFVVSGTMTLYTVGQKTQSVSRYYSQVQTDMRTGMRSATRTIRHGYNVVATSVKTNFPAGSRTSTASQIIVRVPEPSTSGSPDVEIRFYASGGTLYVQRSDAASPGTALITGVQSFTINYFITSGGTRSTDDGTPGTATEAQLTLVDTYGSVTSTVTAYAALRNAIAPL